VDEQRSQALYSEFMQLQEQSGALEQHLQGMTEQLRNIAQTKETINQLGELKTPVEAWVPIAPGAFIKATTPPPQHVLLNVGAGVAVEKTPSEVLETLDGHVKVLEELQSAALEELQRIIARIEEIKAEVAAAEQQTPQSGANQPLAGARSERTRNTKPKQ
jgi:prefoldin alpha subunit